MKLLAVEPIEDYRLLLTYESDEKRVFDVKIMFEKGIFEDLKNKSIFDTVRVAFNTIEWQNGADIDPEDLYVYSTREGEEAPRDAST